MKDTENKGTIVPSTPAQSDGVRSFTTTAADFMARATIGPRAAGTVNPLRTRDGLKQ